MNLNQTVIPVAIAEKLIEEIEDARPNAYARFMGLQSATSTDIAEMSVADLMEAALITHEEAEALMAAVAIADTPSLFGAYGVLRAVVRAHEPP